MEIESPWINNLISSLKNDKNGRSSSALLIINAIKEDMQDHNIPQSSLKTYFVSSTAKLLLQEKQNQNYETLLLLLSTILKHMLVPQKRDSKFLIQENSASIGIIQQISSFMEGPLLSNLQKKSVECQLLILKILKVFVLCKPQNSWEENNLVHYINVISSQCFSDLQSHRKDACKTISYILKNHPNTISTVVEMSNKLITVAFNVYTYEQNNSIYALFFMKSICEFYDQQMLNKMVLYAFGMTYGANEKLSTQVYLTIEEIMAKYPVLYSTSEKIISELFKQTPNFMMNEKLTFSYIQLLVQTLLNFNAVNPLQAKSWISPIIASISELFIPLTEELDEDGLTDIDMVKGKKKKPGNSKENKEIIKKYCNLGSKSIELILISCLDDIIKQDYLGKLDKTQIDFSSMMSLNLADDPNEEMRQKAHENRGGMDYQKKESMTIFEKIVQNLSFLLDKKYSHAFSHITKVFEALFSKVTDDTLTVIIPLFRELYKTGVSLNQSVDSALGKIFKTCSIESILLYLPIQLFEFEIIENDNYDLESNSFLLPLLYKYLPKSRFSAFDQYILPLILTTDQQLKINNESMIQCEEGNKYRLEIYEKAYTQFISQLFSIIDRFDILNVMNDGNKLINYIENLLKSYNRIFVAYVESRAKYLTLMTSFLNFCFNNQNILGHIYAGVVEKISTFGLLTKMCSMQIIDQNQCKSILPLIRTLGYVLGVDFTLKRLTKNIARLNETLSKAGQGKESGILKNLKDVAIIKSLLLSIDNINQDANLYNLVLSFCKTLIKSGHISFIKKGFLILQDIICSMDPSYYSDVLEILVQYLPESSSGTINQMEDESKQTKYQPNVYSAQLKCLITFSSNYLNYCNEYKKDLAQQYIKDIFPIILLSFSQRNKKIRALSLGLLDAIIKNGGSPGKLLQMLTSKLVDANIATKSVIIQLIGTIITKNLSVKTEDSTALILKVAKLITVLLKEENKEIFKASFFCLKKVCKALDNNQLKEMLPKVLGSLLAIDDDVKGRTKLPARNFVDKLIRRFGASVVEELTPSEHKPLIHYLTKQDKLHKKKRELQKDSHDDKNSNTNNSRKFLEDQFLSFVDLNRGKLPRLVESENNETENQKDSQNLLLKYDQHTERFHFVEHPIFTMRKNQKEKDQAAHNANANLTQDKRKSKENVIHDEITNRLIVKQSKNFAGSKRRKELNDNFDLDDEAKEMNETHKKAINFEKKTFETGDQSLAARLYKKIKIDKGKKDRSFVHTIKESGEKFRADGGTHGDRLLTDNVSPHAFIQLNPMALHPKFKDKSAKAFEVVLNTKETGAFKGLKEKKLFKKEKMKRKQVEQTQSDETNHVKLIARKKFFFIYAYMDIYKFNQIKMLIT